MASDKEDEPIAPIAGSREGLLAMPKPVYSRKDVALTEDEVRVNLDITATSSAAVREGLDLVAVLDVSSSMKGKRIESAKRALQFVIMKLTPLDRLSIVTFDGTAKLVSPLRNMTPIAQDKLKGMVGDLKTGRGTDIKSGLVMGLDVISSREHTESRTANIFLMSDGQNMVKNSHPEKVDPGNVVVYTFGFGSGTDHELLTQLARNSNGGTYSSVRDKDNLSTSFAQLLGGLVTVVVQDVRLTLKPKKGLELEEMTVADGSDYKHITDPATDIVTIHFGNLFSGEARTVAVDFKLKNRETERSDFVARLAEAEFSYAAQERRQIPREIRIERKRKPTPRDSNDLELRAVQAEKIRREHAETIREASSLAHAERLDEAREMVVEGQNAIEELDDDQKMLKVLRAELEQLFDYMQTQQRYNDLGHPYALATILSHSRQRAAGRGFEEEVLSLYVTPRMVVYIKQVKTFEKKPEEPVPSADEDVKEEALSNPLAAIAAPLAFYLDDAIHALQAIQKILADATKR